MNTRQLGGWGNPPGQPQEHAGTYRNTRGPTGIPGNTEAGKPHPGSQRNRQESTGTPGGSIKIPGNLEAGKPHPGSHRTT